MSDLLSVQAEIANEISQKLRSEVSREDRQKLTTSYVPPYNIAIVYAGLGDKDQAFGWLDRAFEERTGYLSRLTTDPHLDDLRSDSRFGDLLRRVGLSQ